MPYTCPVCGYLEMPNPPEDYNICSCCGTEFGYEDIELTHEQLRGKWMYDGYPWFSTFTKPPAGWSARGQLRKAGYVSE